jgi:hypothetical protein
MPLFLNCFPSFTNSEPEIEKKGTPAFPAIALASKTTNPELVKLPLPQTSLRIQNLKLKRRGHQLLQQSPWQAMSFWFQED